MTERDSPWKSRPRRDAPAARQDSAPRPYRERPAAVEPAAADAPQRERRDAELRIHGMNALNAVFARRPQAIRKLYLLEARIPQLQPLLKWCVANRVGYRVVEDADLQKLAASAHHEGVVAEVIRAEPAPLTSWLRDLPEGPQCALWLDGVGNPHNLGAILRSAAHFGVTAVLSPSRTGIRLSGAAARVAEGGAESVPLIALDDPDGAWLLLKVEGFTRIATLPAGENSVFKADLPGRTVFVLGAEQSGMRSITVDSCDQQLAIPGSGEVESLNVASAASVFFAEWARRWG